MEMAEYTNSERPPQCDDCRIATAFRARLFDVRKDGYVKVYDCPTCKRLYWEE